MLTREESKKLDPDATFWVAHHMIIPDDDMPLSFLINSWLRKRGSRKRMRAIVCEDAVRATGLWTPEQVGDVADRMIFGEDGEMVDPKSIRYFFSSVKTWFKKL